MKTIKLKAFKEKILFPELYLQNGAVLSHVEETRILTTVGLIKDVAYSRPRDGYDPKDMIKRFKLLGYLDKVEKEFELNGIKAEDVSKEFLEREIELKIEDADYEFLSELAKQMRWGIMSKFIVEFVNNFTKNDTT